MSHSKVFDMISKEELRQKTTVELIASENFVSQNIQRAMGSCLTNKYAEGYPGHRYYGGCKVIDEIESYCQEQWKKAFNTGYHVNVQPHSGTSANIAAYTALLKPGDTILSMGLNDGGHLSHGHPVNLSGKLYIIHNYRLDGNGFIDYDDIEQKIKSIRPRMVVAGASAYSRQIDFKRIKEIIDANSDNFYRPYFLADISHIAGLVVCGYHPSPFGYADVITTTTHKTLRGPRGALIFCRPELAKKIDSAIFPGIQGGPLEHVIAAKAICAEEACTDGYKSYIFNVIINCASMANRFKQLGYKVVTDGTDNHMFLLDLTDTGISGKELQDYLEDEYDITLNKNMIPGDTRSPKETSGVRIGAAAMTTRGYGPLAFSSWAEKIDRAIKELQQNK